MLEEMIADPRRGLSDSQYWTRPLCNRWLEYVDEVVHFEPARALALAFVGVRLALRTIRSLQRRGFRDRSILARAYGLLGSVCRANSRRERARHAFEKALKIARSCSDPDVHSELCRRRAHFCAYEAQRPDGTLDPDGLRKALELAEEGVRKARKERTAIRARFVRSLLRIRTGQLQEAADDARWALDKVDPTECPFDHMSALSVLVSALTKGNREDREEAAGYMEQLRQELPPRSPILRAQYEWAEALLLFASRQRKMRARRRLDHARRTFVRRKMVPQAVAVTADLVRHKPEGTVVQFCEELLTMLDPGPLHDLVETLRSARFPDRAEIAEELREAVGGRPGLLPAPA